MKDTDCPESESTLEERSEMFYKVFKWKNVLAFCILIFLFHIAITISMTKYAEPSSKSNEDDFNIVITQKVRQKRDTNNLASKHLAEFKLPNTIIDPLESEYNLDLIKQSIDLDGWSRNGLCQNGHAQDIVAHCEAVGCLRKLHMPPTHEPPVSYLDGRVSKEFLQDVQRSRGRLQKIHLDLISLLTDIQWHHGIFGSVAVLGDETGYMTKLLAVNADISEGENMFIVSGDQDISKHFNMLDKSLKQNIYHCPGYSNFSKVYLLQNDIPQFRFVSISSADSYSLPHLLQIATCVIRDGGILVVDNLKSNQLTEFVKRYYSAANQHATIKPLLATDNKIYFSSPRWKPIYTEKLLHSQSSNFVALHLQMSKDNLFHGSGRYLLSNL